MFQTYIPPYDRHLFMNISFYCKPQVQTLMMSLPLNDLYAHMIDIYDVLILVCNVEKEHTVCSSLREHFQQICF